MFQVQEDLLKIYFSEEITEIEKNSIKEVLDDNTEIEWIVVDMESISELDNNGLEILELCTMHGAEVVAINTNSELKTILSMCFIDTPQMFNYMPDSEKLLIMCEIKKDICFLSDRLAEFINEQTESERDLKTEIIDFLETINNSNEYVQISCTIVNEKVLIQVLENGTLIKEANLDV